MCMTNNQDRAFEVNNQRFRLSHYPSGKGCITSTHPYDETEYHWAYEITPYVWQISRETRRLRKVYSSTGKPLTAEEVAKHILQADLDAHLKPTPASIW